MAHVSDIHQPELKYKVSVRFTASDMRRLRKLARSEDRSLNSLVTRIVRAELDSIDAREMAQ